LDHEVTETVTIAAGRRDSTLPALSFVGAGRTGRVLALAARRAGYPVAAVASRTPAHAAQLAHAVGATPVATPIRAARAADLTFLTVPDAAVTRVAATIAASGMALGGRGVVHCSGAHSAAAIGALRQVAAQVGAVHPLQALTPDSDPAVLRGTHVSIEADPGLRATVTTLVEAIGGIPFDAPRGDRALYHAAAVLAGNAPLGLVARAAGLLQAAGLEPAMATEALATLLEGAARNVRRLGPQAALTGPVVRNDADTVARHLHALRADGATRRLYTLLARDTLELAGHEGREAVADLLGVGPRPQPRELRVARRRTAA
jgi:predicted short-subunit dehydrogenase-like oxidoreductase (DUF2520 family)